jgi:hypothetical protein
MGKMINSYTDFVGKPQGKRGDIWIEEKLIIK